MTRRKPKNAYCDQGYRGHGIKNETNIVICGKIPKRASRAVRKWMKRRVAIEPVIGYLKSDNRLSRSHIKGTQVNEANVVLVAAGYNFSKLLVCFCCVWLILGVNRVNNLKWTDNPVQNTQWALLAA